MIDAERATQSEASLEAMFSQLGDARRKILAGEALFLADAPASSLFLVHSGQVRIFHNRADGSLRLLAIIGPGQWCGSSALFARQTYGCSAIAVDEVVVSQAPIAKVLERLADMPEAARTIIHHLARRLYSSWDDAGNLIYDDCRERLIKALVRFSQTPAALHQGQDVVLRMTHEQLAQAIGVARETVSLCITELRKEDRIRTGRNQLSFRIADLTSMLPDVPPLARAS